MLNFLHIRNFAIVESLELEFGPGFTCISGETGAGKSILVGALGLLCGNRADSGAVGPVSEKAELAAGFFLEKNSPALAWLTENDLDDGQDCLLRRTVHSNGRSRAWINGSAVTAQQLASLGRRLVEIHGQNEHLRLLRADEAFRILDTFGGHEALCDDVMERFNAWQVLAAERQALLDETPLEAGDRELLAYQVQELESSILPAEERERLEKEHRVMARGGDIVEALEFARNALQDETAGASSALHRALRALESHEALDDDIASAVSLLNEAVINCGEAESAIDSATSRMDLSPERLAELERVLGTLHDLARKHRVRPDELSGVLRQLSERLDRASTRDRRLASLDVEIERSLLSYRDAASRLGDARSESALTLSGRVSELMQDLGMAGGQFVIEVLHDADSAPSARGDDRLDMKVSGNRGIEPGPLRKVASGGELSRISLAVKAASRADASVATQVFDEVDAGIGGATASVVGAMIRRLSTGGQSLCVTHLAQVAAFADMQITVRKDSEGEGTSVKASALSGEGRIEEVARMLGGQVSRESLAHAASLIGEAAATRH